MPCLDLKTRVALPLLASLFCGGVAVADTVTLTPSQDATLYQEAAGNLANGGGDYLFTGRTNSTALIRRTVLAFDVAASVPAGSLISAATLTLRVDRGGGSQQQRLHRVTHSWNEGAIDSGFMEGDGSLADPGDVTWTSRAYQSTLWDTPGGDFVATASATATATSPPSILTFSGAGLVADVEHWVANPGENFGWLIRAVNEGSRSTKRFGSRDGAEAQQATLQITFLAVLFADDFESGDLSAWSESLP